MSDLCDFLRARLDEDEQVARCACEYADAAWHLDEEFGETVLWWPPEPHVAEAERRHGLRVTSDQWRGQTIGSSGAQIAPHIARHDPARVLREVERDRRMLALHDRQHHQCVAEDGPTQWHAKDPCATLRLLALPYVDHPDYRAEEWKP